MERNIMRKAVQLLKCKRAVQLNLIIKLNDYWIFLNNNNNFIEL